LDSINMSHWTPLVCFMGEGGVGLGDVSLNQESLNL
jgi:hypothetical protein